MHWRGEEYYRKRVQKILTTRKQTIDDFFREEKSNRVSKIVIGVIAGFFLISSFIITIAALTSNQPKTSLKIENHQHPVIDKLPAAY